MKASFKMTGALELSKALAEIQTEVATKVGEQAVRSTAKSLEARLILVAPVDNRPGGLSERYGHLRDNIRTRKIKPRKADRVVFRVGVGSAFWGTLVEFGTAKMPAHPWFRPTWDSMQGELASGIVNGVRVGIERATKRAARLAKKKG